VCKKGGCLVQERRRPTIWPLSVSLGGGYLVTWAFHRALGFGSSKKYRVQEIK